MRKMCLEMYALDKQSRHLTRNKLPIGSKINHTILHA